MCVPACCRRNITSASLCSWMRPGSCFMMNNYHFQFFLSRTFLATRRKYIYLSFCFPSMNYTAPREQLYFLHLAYAEREMVKTEWVFFFYASYNSYWKHSVSGLHCTTIEAIFRRGVETQFVTAWLLNIMNKTVSVMTDVLIIVYHSGGYSWLCSAQKDCCLTLGSAESRPEPRWV